MQQTRTNPFAYGKPITLDTLDELFSHHRGLTGGWSMEDPPEPPAPPAPPAPPEPPAYTPPASQADLDRIIASRLEREKAKYADYEALKQKAAEHDKAVEAAKTDAEKAIEAARSEGESKATEAANARVVRSEAKVALAGAGARNADAAVKLLDLAGLKVGDDGEVDAAALKTKVDALKSSDAYLFDDGKKAPPKPDKSQGGGGDDKPSLNRGAERARARHPHKTAS